MLIDTCLTLYARLRLYGALLVSYHEHHWEDCYLYPSAGQKFAWLILVCTVHRTGESGKDRDEVAKRTK